MQFNVQKQETQDLQFLLEWLNVHRASVEKSTRIYTLSQLQQEATVQQILCKVDHSIFAQFGTMDSNQKVDSLEKYLEKSLGKRMKWSFKQKLSDLSEQNHTWQFLKLLCYIAINSSPKNQFISQILNLGECSQVGLMRLMTRMSKNLENITEIRQIIQHIDDLEQQNEDLRQKLIQLASVNNKLLSLVKDLEQQNRQSKATTQQLRDQKIRVFKLLGIDYIEDYVDIFNKIKLQNQKLEQYSEQIQAKFKASQSANIELNQKIRQQYTVIDNLEDQIARLKTELSDNQSCWSPSTKMNILKSANSNKENLSKCSTSLNKSLFSGAEWTKVVDVDDENSQKVSIFNHNQINMQKLEEMYHKYNILNDQNTNLTERNKKLSQNNTKLRKILAQISDSNKQYEFVLHASDIEAKIVMDRYMCRSKIVQNQ